MSPPLLPCTTVHSTTTTEIETYKNGAALRNNNKTKQNETKQIKTNQNKTCCCTTYHCSVENEKTTTLPPPMQSTPPPSPPSPTPTLRLLSGVDNALLAPINVCATDV
jgi:hypothetical protein